MIKSKVELAPGLEIPRIINGLWQIADMERGGEVLDPDEAARHMIPFAEEGFHTFDMADHYGSSEIIAGRFKNNIDQGRESQLFTKWVPTPGSISMEQVREAVNRALDRMQQPTINMMQFHAWHYPDPSWLDGLYHLKALQGEGKIQHLGVTNFDTAHLRIALSSGIPTISNQICYSLLDQRASKGMTDLCEEFGIKILAFGTLAGGFLTDRWLGREEPSQEELSTWSEMKYKRFIDAAGGWAKYQQLLDEIKMVARKHNVSIANIATRYILEDENVAAVIIGARLGKSEHIADNKRMLQIELDKEDLEKIKVALAELEPIAGDCGDEYRKPPFLTASGDLSHHVESFPSVYDVVQLSEHRTQVFSGTVWEEFAGYSRAVKDGNRIHVSGTTATHGKLLIGGNDPAAQTHFVIDKIEAAINSLGGKLSDVVRTRVFVNDVTDWEPVARAHGNRFHGINPANTLVEAKLVGEGYLVEIEAEAVVH